MTAKKEFKPLKVNHQKFEANKNYGTGGHTKLFSIWNELDTKLKIPGSEFNKSKI